MSITRVFAESSNINNLSADGVFQTYQVSKNDTHTQKGQLWSTFIPRAHSRCACAPASYSYSHLHDLINYCREATQAERSASLPPPRFVCSWFARCLLIHYLLELCLCVYEAAGYKVLFTLCRQSYIHCGREKRSQDYCRQCTFYNYSFRKACYCKLLLGIF